MSQSVRIFKNGHSQALRLPSAYHFDCKEVFISKDPITGHVILSRKPGSWDDFFELIKNPTIPAEFMGAREDSVTQDRDIF